MPCTHLVRLTYIKRGKDFLLAVIMFLFVYYVTGYGSITYEYIIQVSGIALVAYLLWRVETLQDLNLGFHPTFSLPRHSPNLFGLCSRLHENVPISSENIVVADATPIDDSDAMDTMIATEEKEEADASLSRVGVAFWGCDSFRIVKSASKS